MEFEITWLGQAGYILDFGCCRGCIDPYLSNTVEEIEGMKRMVPVPVKPEELDVDYILFTHDHLDHFDQVSICRLAHRPITFMGPGSCIGKLEECGIHNNTRLERYQQTVVGGRITLRAAYACHTRDSIGLLFQDKGNDTGGLYITGDTEYTEKLTEIKSYAPDAMIVCINGKLGNMDYRSAARLAQEIGVKTAIPCHYGMFGENTEDPENFRSALSPTGVEYRELKFMRPEKAVLTPVNS